MDALAGGLEALRQLLQLGGREAESRMRPPGRRVWVFDADVELAASAQREPHTAARAQRLRLLDLCKAEQVAEEVPRLRLAARRRCNLHVV